MDNRVVTADASEPKRLDWNPGEIVEFEGPAVRRLDWVALTLTATLVVSGLLYLAYVSASDGARVQRCTELKVLREHGGSIARVAQLESEIARWHPEGCDDIQG